jgi:hypothetical protein
MRGARAPLRTTSAASHTVWLSQLHLHFALGSGERAAGVRRQSARDVTTLGRGVRVHPHPHMRGALTAAGAGVARRLASRSSAARSAEVTSRVLVPARATRAHPVPLQPRVARGVEHAHRARVGRVSRPESQPVGVARRGARLILRRVPSEVDEIGARASRVATRGHRSEAQASPSREATPRANASQHLELRWRSGSRSSPRSSEERPGHESRTAAQHTAIERAPFQDAASSVAAQAAGRAATQIAQLAPELVDRLAEDVIRRVERRVRIDRERRGL